MKQKDLALIIIIVVVAAFISLFISNKLFATPSNRQQQVEVVQPISSSLQTPNPAYFNSNSKDPTQLITIGQSANSNPF